jgi:hypothetical protein
VKKSFNRKSFLLPLLLLATGSAWAGWERVGESDTGIFYVDRATIRKDGNLRRMWSVEDLKQRNESGAMSRRLRYEYDCKGERSRILALSTHTEPMADGKTLYITTGDLNESWDEIPPGSAIEKLLATACAR